MLSVKQGSIFTIVWVFGMVRTQVSRAIGKHPNNYANVWYIEILDK